MIYFIVLYLLYILSEKLIIIEQKDSSFSKKIKALSRLFVIMFIILNFYGYCVSNIVYSCVLIYIISFIKNDDVKDFLDTFRLYKKEGFQIDNIDNIDNSNKIFRRKIPDLRHGKTVKQQYMIDANQLNSVREEENEYNNLDLMAIKHQLENRLWITSENDNKLRINVEDQIKLDSIQKETEEEEEELLRPVKNIKTFLTFLLSLVGL